jgi:hypothetical protein
MLGGAENFPPEVFRLKVSIPSPDYNQNTERPGGVSEVYHHT